MALSVFMLIKSIKVSYRSVFLGTLLMMGFYINNAFALSTLYLKENNQFQLSGNKLEYGTSDSQNIRPEKYRTLSRPFLTNENPSKFYWARIQIINNTSKDKEWYLVSYNYTISSFDFYLENKKGELLQTNHYSYPASNLSESVVLNQSPTFHLLLPKNDTSILYLRIQHTTTSQFGFELTEHGYFFNHKIIRNTLLGLFYGALIILAVYHLLFYFQLKESFYGWYAVFILFQVLYLSFRDGMALTLFFNQCSICFDHLYPWIMSCLSIATLFYARTFLGLQKHKKINYIIIAFILGRLLLNIYLTEYTIFYMMIDFSSTLLALLFCIYSLRNKRMETYIFMISLIFIISGYSINILWHADWIDNTETVFESLYYTVLFEALLFSLANSYRLRRLQQQEVENKQKESLIEIKNDLILQQNSIIQERTEALETFLYKASHDLKGPLKSIDGLCQLGRKDTRQPAVYFELIQNSSARLQGILESLLQLAKQNEQELTIQSVQLNDLVDTCIQQIFKGRQDIKPITIYNKLSSSVFIMTDYFALFSVVQNIIENAIKYQDTLKIESTLTIEYTFHESRHEIRFKDNGIGIPASSIDRIFEMFYRANTSNNNGVGLGMYIVKHTIQRLKGKVSIQSEQNEYTQVTVELPVNPLTASLS